ncbi:hypothetical protein [Cellulomonas sp. URHD0024]|uniref:hypothetical protein n=1 Tax=Cellulomonas sp. URHD0024 TaxID=1302620 RepID=UPI00041CF6AC|nr:hypothetical protein [Cellulomonas sp. URHD0024]
MFLTLVLIGFLAVATIVSVRWVLTRVDVLGRVGPFPKISVGLCLAVAVGCAVPLGLHARLEHRLQDGASQVAGGSVAVHCQTAGETWTDLGSELGYVRWTAEGVPERRTVIKYRVCGDLRSWLSSDKRDPGEDQVVAVHVLSHETMHMVGIDNEAQAECAALQRDAEMAEALGATPTEAQALAHRYWVEVYPRMPDGYTGGCGPDSRWDEHLALAPW